MGHPCKLGVCCWRDLELDARGRLLVQNDMTTARTGSALGSNSRNTGRCANALHLGLLHAGGKAEKYGRVRFNPATLQNGGSSAVTLRRHTVEREKVV